MSDQMIGKILGKYKIVEKLGSGGMADVYKGIQEGLEREVAIKVLPKAYSRDAEMVKRFKRESQATAKLAHPNIITIYDSGEQEGLCYYVMEYLKADSLDDIIKQEKKLPPKKALKIAQDILKALAYTHDKHILHRDLKPSNIKFDLRGNAIVTDFGLVKDLEQTSITVSGVSLGTPMYMSPEQLSGDPVDERSDIYQVGVIFYEMLTGQPPYAGGPTPQAGSRAIPGTELRPPSLLNTEVAPELDELIVKALQKKPEDRFQSAKEALEKLKQIERKSKVRQLSRQAPSGTPGTRSVAVRTGSIPSQPVESFPSSGALSAQSISIAIARTLTGPSRTLALAIGIPSVFLLAAGLVWLFMLIFPKPELKLLEKSFEVEADQAIISWRASYPCYSYLEYGTTREDLARTEPPSNTQTEYRQYLKNLKADTTYIVRFLFSYDSDLDSFPAAWTREYTIRTRPQIEVSNITVEEGTTQATISWTTNLRTDTVVQYGKTEEYGTTQSNFEQKAELNHSIVLTGLDPATVYHFKIIASDPEGRGGSRTSEDRTFTTKDTGDPEGWGGGRSGFSGSGEDQLQDLAKSYVDKLTRMTPDERAKLKESINRFIDIDQGPLPEEKKAACMSPTTSQTFPDRIQIYQKWRKEVVERRADLSKRMPDRMYNVLQKLFLDNKLAACRQIDRYFQLLREADPVPGQGAAPASAAPEAQPAPPPDPLTQPPQRIVPLPERSEEETSRR